MDDEETRPLLHAHNSAPGALSFSSVKIWPLIYHIRADITTSLDAALSWDQLTSPDVNFTLVRPLVQKYASIRNPAIAFALLVVRAHFLSTADDDLAHSNVKLSRASLAELLACKMLKHFAHNQIELVAVLTVNWSAIAGAPREVRDAVKLLVGGREEDLDDPASAIEIAIATESKHFLSTPLAQTVINDIYTGRVIYTVASTRSLIADNYKQRDIAIYDPKQAPWLDHYRLRVPKYSQILEFINFTFLLLAFLLCLSNKRFDRINVYELIFLVFASAFALGEYGQMREHGWEIYMANMWNGFDTAFISIFLTYFGLRLKGVLAQDDWYSELAFDIMACGACILFPRLAFFAISNNVVILALRGMIAEFIFFIVIAAICFSGLLFTLWDLAGGTWTVKNIAWLMTQIWFGNTSLSFNQASSFHPLFGPPLMVLFAALSNTLLITILISILSNTFARIDQHATQEYLFQFAISTVEGVKSDALFSYQPPFNILAFLLLAPLSLVASPRTLHSVNVFLIRLTSFPILIIISIYERYLAPGRPFLQKSQQRTRNLLNSLPRHIKSAPIIEAIVGANGTDLLEAIFDVDVDPTQLEPLFMDESRWFERAQILTQQSDPGRSRSQSVSGTKDTTVPIPVNGGATTSKPVTPAQGGLQVDTLSPPLPSPAGRASRSPGRASAGPVSSTSDNNKLRKRSQTPAARPVSMGGHLMTFEEEQQTGFQSPLARLFSSAQRKPPRPIDYDATMGRGSGRIEIEECLGGIRRLEGMVESLKEREAGDGVSGATLRKEVKDLQERQARIEALLLTLTRGMRGESGLSKSPM